ncbi:MAG: ATPase [Prevotella sp.]|nr:ATPase [Prevotella sp.]
MVLIADSGSTKTDWVLVDGERRERFFTQGMNPVLMSEIELEEVLLAAKRQVPKAKLLRVFFYGAGCREDVIPKMELAINRVFHPMNDEEIEIKVQSDLMAAARALCGRQEGIACILGTGVNSCLFDGERIVANTPPLGFILGDEGSGAVLGKLFVNALYKGRLPILLRREFEEVMNQSLSAIIHKVYREPMPNRFLASFAPFIQTHLDVPEVADLCIENFQLFFRYNINPYQRHDLRVNAVGSVAFHFADLLHEAARKEGYEMGLILKSPMEGLVNYHQSVIG